MLRPARALRWLVLRTSVPPIDGAYRALYRALIHASVVRLRRCPGVVSIYLCRGCAKREIVPGLSDIDFMIIARDEADLPEIRRAFERIARTSLGRVEYYPKLVKTHATFEHRWRTAPVWQHRYLEGKSTWELLHGIDALAALPPLSVEQERAAIYQEMNRWWLLFAHHVLGETADGGRRDEVVARSICYKAVAELRNLRQALWSGELRTSRRHAFAGDDSSLARRLERQAASRFLVRDEALFDDTLRWLLDFFRELWREFARRPYLRIDARCAQSLAGAAEGERARAGAAHVRAGTFTEPRGLDHAGFDPREAARAGDIEHSIRELAAHLDRHWGDRCGGLSAVRSAFWDFDDRLLLIALDRERLPSVEEIAALVALHRRLDSRPLAEPRTHLFLRDGDLCFPLAPELPRDLHRGILTPAAMPDVFLQLGTAPVYWTDYTKWYLVDWRTNEQWPAPSDEKRRQLEAIARGYEEGAIVYPLTRDELERVVAGARG